MQNKQEPILLRPRQAAEALSVSRSTLFELLKTGQLRRVRLGRRSVGIPRSEIDAFIQARLEKAA